MNKKKRIWIYSLIVIGLVFANGCKKDDGDKNTVKDIDGNVYHTVTIGTQVWMVENLKVTHFRNGDAIPEVTDNSWNNLGTIAYCNYENTRNKDTIATYGRLYNWYAVHDSRNIAPSGWHVPADDEWTKLTEYLGGESIACAKLQETGTLHWLNNNNEGATNETGFTALPGGRRHHTDEFGFMREYGYWWSTTEHLTSFAWYRFMDWNFDRKYDYKGNGFSVRCVKD